MFKKEKVCNQWKLSYCPNLPPNNLDKGILLLEHNSHEDGNTALCIHRKDEYCTNLCPFFRVQWLDNNKGIAIYLLCAEPGSELIFDLEGNQKE